MRRLNQLVEGISKFLCIGDLFLLVLLLQNSVEIWHNISVYLALRQQGSMIRQGEAC